TRPSIGCSTQRRRFSRNLTGAISPVTSSKFVVTGRNTPPSRLLMVVDSGKGPHLELEVSGVVGRRLGDLVCHEIVFDEFAQVLVERLGAVLLLAVGDQVVDLGRPLAIQDGIGDR